MKIVLVHNFYQQPGGEDVTFHKERDLLRQAGHEVLEYCRSNYEVDQYSSLIGQISLAKRTIWASQTRSEFRELLFRERPHLVHVYNTFLMISPSIYSACQDAGVPVVQTLQNFRFSCPRGDFFRAGRVCEECKEHTLLRGIRYGCYRSSRPATATVALMIETHRWKQTWTQMVDRYIALTQFSCRKLCEAQLPSHKLVVKPNFVDRDPGVKDTPGSYVLFAGRLSLEKGLETLLSAWKLLPRTIPLRIVGDGPLREELEAQTTQHGLSNVYFQGRLEHKDVIAAMQGARFVVFPSECYENCPNTILEAFACGRPVIASRLGGMQELVGDSRTGLHFRASDPSDLAEKVQWAWSHPDQIAAMARQARAEYEDKYTPEKSYQRLMEIYGSVISARPSRLEAGQGSIQ
jgi:glycosyltransferase involved in cell wall biosynthesis